MNATGDKGLSQTGYARVLEAFTQIDAALSIVLGVHQSIGYTGIVLFGTDAQKERCPNFGECVADPFLLELAVHDLLAVAAQQLLAYAAQLLHLPGDGIGVDLQLGVGLCDPVGPQLGRWSRRPTQSASTPIEPIGLPRPILRSSKSSSPIGFIPERAKKAGRMDARGRWALLCWLAAYWPQRKGAVEKDEPF